MAPMFSTGIPEKFPQLGLNLGICSFVHMQTVNTEEFTHQKVALCSDGWELVDEYATMKCFLYSSLWFPSEIKVHLSTEETFIYIILYWIISLPESISYSHHYLPNNL